MLIRSLSRVFRPVAFLATRKPNCMKNASEPERRDPYNGPKTPINPESPLLHLLYSTGLNLHLLKRTFKKYIEKTLAIFDHLPISG